MNALIGSILEIDEEVPGGAILDARTGPSQASRPRRHGRLGPGDSLRFGWLLGPFLLLLAWSTGSAAGLIDSRVLPAPWTTAATAWQLIREGRLPHDLAVSALRVAQGFVWGAAVAIVCALASGLSQLGGYLIDGLVQIKRSIPVLALIPLIILWFGIGETMKVTVIAISVFVPIYIQTHAALRGIDLKHVELAETLGLGRWAFIRQVVLPGALPGVLTGLRFGVLGAWLALVVVEQLNATSGIGYMINLARTYAQSDVILVGLVVYALLGLTSDAAVRLLERRSLAWRRSFSA
ncbi:MAG TPA: ABC transporter permease [Caulobacteraceae bacterium]|jgi:sulfonate transport system permease protein|nr:ABC transporter permease [Caulobacteraceae bacterium]